MRSERPALRRADRLLTARELEIAALIRQGLTNREIAERRIIAERTADTHLQNILNKLGVTSRAQVAAWFVEHGVACRTISPRSAFLLSNPSSWLIGGRGGPGEHGGLSARAVSR